MNELMSAVKQIETLLMQFVPTSEGTNSTTSWKDVVEAYDTKFDARVYRLDLVDRNIEKIGASSLDSNPTYNDLLIQASKLNTEQLQQLLSKLTNDCRDWYEQFFKLEYLESSTSSSASSKQSFKLKDMYVEMKVLRESKMNSSAKDDALDGLGETVADSKSLHKYLDKSKLVLVEGAAGIGKTVFCKQFCVLQSIEIAIAIFDPLKQLFRCGPINSIVDLLIAIEAPIAVKEVLPEIIKYNIPIVWVRDGYDEVMLTKDINIVDLLHNFLDPATRKTNVVEKKKIELVRSCDSVILISRENRVDSDAVKLSGLQDSSICPDLWIVQRWQQSAIESFMKKFFEHLKIEIKETKMRQIVYHALGPEMQGFHGIPLFVKLLCEVVAEDSRTELRQISPPFLYERTLRNALKFRCFQRKTCRKFLC